MAGGRINGGFTASRNYANNVSGKETSGNEKSVLIKLTFSPDEIGARRQPNGQYPPSRKITENAAETALLKHFGFNISDAADAARVKQLLQTEGSPFSALKTTGELVAVYNDGTGKYEINDHVEQNLYLRLQGRAAEVKTQIKNEEFRQFSLNLNEAIAFKRGYDATGAQRVKLDRLLREAQVLPISFGIPSKLTDLTHVVVRLPEGSAPSGDTALSAYIEKRYGGDGNLFGQDKNDILNAAKQLGVKVENLKISPNDNRTAEFDLNLESVLKLQKAYLNVQEKVNQDIAVFDDVKDKAAINQFLLGVMSGAKDDLVGSYNTIRHPMETLQGIREAADILSQLSAQDIKAIAAELGNKAINATPGEAAYGAGYVVGTAIVEVILAKGAGAALSELGKTRAGAEFLARIGKLAERTGELANLGKAKVAEAFSDEAAALAASRLRSRLATTTLYAGVPADALADLTIVAANKVKNGAVKFSEFSRQMINEVGEQVKPYLEKLYRESLISLNLNEGKQILSSSGKMIDEAVVREAKVKVLQFVQENKVKELKQYLAEIGNKYGTEFQNELKKMIEKSIDNIYESRRTPELYDMLGGHTIYDLFDGKIDTKHVGKTVEQLRERFVREPNLLFSSSFKNLETANRAQMKFIKHFEKEIAKWLKGGATRPFSETLELGEDLGKVVGKGKFGVKVGTKVQVTLAKDGTEQGWHIVTSFPVP